MFNDTSVIKEVNVLIKAFCYLLVLIMLIICKDTIYLLFVDMFFLLVTKKFNKLFIFNLVITGLIVLNIFFPYFLGISKFGILILYTILLTRVTKLEDLRYVVEYTFYIFKNKKITYKLFYWIFFIKTFNNHFNKMLLLKDDYGIKSNIKFLLFILKQSYNKAKMSKKDFIEINRIRFYNYSSERTYIEKITWESWDTYYLLVHIILTAITFFYGR